MLKDSTQRSLAIDPEKSFIVQAPAGSGKTELLTQRFLRLLGLVSEPEQIIALTFTRKAASEMRERIMQSLIRVAQGEQAKSSHQEQTFRLAKLALKQDQHFGWQLLEQPHRLRIMTIDALCQLICHAIPLQEKQLPYTAISNQPESCYQNAARASISYALKDSFLQPSLQTLLRHLDNRQDRIIELFSQLLSTRDQWLEMLFEARDRNQSIFEEALFYIEQHTLNRFINTVPSTLRDDLRILCMQMARTENNPQSPRYSLHDWTSFDSLDRTKAKALAELLLTGKNELRKAFDHHVGLRKDACEAKEYAFLKTTSKTLLEQLAENSDFCETLQRIRHLPLPHYENEQWEVLQALFALLPILVAHLQIVFKEINACDFTTIAQQALFALGTEEQPTDLTLYLDNSINHLLVDEFQDTSIQQFQLLQKIVQEWYPGDGKTLFIVGDPMQSIYRFRQAEVGLFLKAKQQGIGKIKLEPITLCSNFRSTPTLVNWVNSNFQTLFPQQEDIESGAISFHSSEPVLEHLDNSHITAWQCTSPQQEALAIVELAEQELNHYPQETIAILVRSRSHLSEIVKLLRARQIPYQGVEIEQLSLLAHIQDIWSLTKALLFPADRLAWLAVLRSPWCGLSLNDLQIIANFDPRQSIYHALQHLQQLADLSEEGLLRGLYFKQVINDALAQRQQQSLTDWVAHTAIRLHADHLFDAREQADLEQYWLLLDEYSQDAQINDIELFKSKLKTLYSQHVSPSRLQIMTIHKSKGLEFDCVILPGLGRKPNGADQSLFRWLKIPSPQQEYLLISPIRAAYKQHCLLYNYLGELAAEKEHYELQRLLYVAVTRAKKRLYLADGTSSSHQSSFKNLLTQQPFLSYDCQNNEKNSSSMQELFKLPLDFYRELPPVTPPDNSAIVISKMNNARQIGIITHELLQWICHFHPTQSEELPWPMISNQLKSIGINPERLSQILSEFKLKIDYLFQDSIGQWICKAHPDEKNEYELLVNDGGVAKIRIIDRTFFDQGIRWIIDFKTGKEDELSLKQHQKQVNNYAQLLASLYKEPIHCGLYYFSTQNWISWPYQGI